jgi:Rrf2 family iron-sulfur cluster assembly transcriptional regulator
MQIVLGSRGDYTVRAVLYLVRHPGVQRRSAIATAMEIPEKYLPQILGALVRAGIVRSTRGRSGGYELARNAGGVTLRDVIEVAEGPIRSQKCVLRGGPCYWGERCAMHDAWSAAQSALVEQLADTSFADLAMADWELEQQHPRVHPGPNGERRVHATGADG